MTTKSLPSPCILVNEMSRTDLFAESDIETEMHDVAVLDDVLLSFEPHLPRLFRALLAAVSDVVAVRDRFGANESLLEIRVDDAGGLWRGSADANGPRAHFLIERRNDSLRFLVAARARGLRVLAKLLVDRSEIGERQFRVDRFDVGDRIDLSGDMHDVAVVEAAHDMRDRVHLANVGEKLIAEAFAFRRAGDKPRDVDELDRRRNHFLRLRDRGELRQTRIGHFDDADVRLDRAERIILRRDARLGERVEERRFADVRQPDDSAANGHG